MFKLISLYQLLPKAEGQTWKTNCDINLSIYFTDRWYGLNGKVEGEIKTRSYPYNIQYVQKIQHLLLSCRYERPILAAIKCATSSYKHERLTVDIRYIDSVFFFLSQLLFVLLYSSFQILIVGILCILGNSQTNGAIPVGICRQNGWKLSVAGFCRQS